VRRYWRKSIHMVNHNVEHKEIIMEGFIVFCLGMGIAALMFLIMFVLLAGINKLIGEDYDI